MMTIEDFMDYCWDPCAETIAVFDVDSEETIYKGKYYDMPQDLRDARLEHWAWLEDAIELGISRED